MITSVINQKGGTGKTTTAVNLASALSKKKKKVLVIDFDPQGNLSYSLGINDFNYSVSDLLSGKKGISEIFVEREGVHIIPTDLNLSKFKFEKKGKKKEFILKEALKKVKGYDHVLIDCPPSLSALTVNALSASDNVIIPIQLDVFSIQGLEQIRETINEVRSSFNKNLKTTGVLPVLVDGRKKLTTEVKDYVKENFDVPLFKSEIRTNVKAAEAPSFGQSVIAYSPSSNSAKDYMQFAAEFLRKTKLN
ncbi:MAG: ParA family protein [Cyclobacteriaceae bacterium]